MTIKASEQSTEKSASGPRTVLLLLLSAEERKLRLSWRYQGSFNGDNAGAVERGEQRRTKKPTRKPVFASHADRPLRHVFGVCEGLPSPPTAMD
jgi:hypothetical protein